MNADEHGNDVQRKMKTIARAAADGVNGIGRRARDGGGRAGGGFAFLGFRQQDFRDHQRGGTIQHRRREQVSGGVGIAGAHAHVRINRRDAAGDVRHAADHDGHQFAARQARDVRPDHQRRLGLAHENVRGGGKRFAAARAHDFAHHPREGADHLLQNAPVIKQRRNARDDDDGAHDENGEDHRIAGAEFFREQILIRQRAETQICSLRWKIG